MEDRRLIADCLSGRTAAYGELVRRYKDRLFNTVYRMVDNAEDAEDIVQETFLNAYQALSGFKGDSQFFTWLYRIARNSAISHQRKQRAVLSLHPGSNGREGGTDPIDGSDASQPGLAMERAEDEARLQDALNRLSGEHRLILILKDIDGQKYEEIAEVLGVPVGTVRSRLHRARAELRDLLQAAEEPNG